VQPFCTFPAKKQFAQYILLNMLIIDEKGVRVHCGVEAGTDEILNNLRKGITVDMIKKAFATTQKAGIEAAAYFMLGNPGEKLSDIKQSVKIKTRICSHHCFSALSGN